MLFIEISSLSTKKKVQVPKMYL